MQFGEWLKLQMDSQATTALQLAKDSEVSVEMIRALIRGVRLPSFRTVIDLCAVLQCNMEDAAFCEEFMSDKRLPGYHQLPKGKTNAQDTKDSAKPARQATIQGTTVPQQKKPGSDKTGKHSKPRSCHSRG